MRRSMAIASCSAWTRTVLSAASVWFGSMVAGSPTAASSRFARSLGHRFLESSGIALRFATWKLGPLVRILQCIHPGVSLQDSFFIFFNIYYALTNEKSKVTALGNLSATFEMRI